MFCLSLIDWQISLGMIVNVVSQAVKHTAAPFALRAPRGPKNGPGCEDAHETRLNDVVVQRLPRSTPQRLLQAKDCFASLIDAHGPPSVMSKSISLVAVARKWGREIGLDRDNTRVLGPLFSTSTAAPLGASALRARPHNHCSHLISME